MRTGACSILATFAVVGVTSAAEAKCVRAAGEATAITHELATELAKVALNSSINSWGGKGVGKTHTSCKYELVLSTCKVQRRACK